MIEAALRDSRIVIVDDQEANVRLLERLLAASGFGNVRSFRSGTAFLGALATDEPDLVLLDLHMPELDGFGVLEILASRAGPDDYRPVLVLTADAERGARSRALAGGAKDFLVKPLDAEEVILRVRNLLETRALHQALRARNVDLAAEVTALRTLEVSERRRTDELRERIRATISASAFTPVFQPIVRLEGGQVVGYEALTRFADGTPPDRFFAAAAEAGLGGDLEAACLAAAIRVAGRLMGQRWLSLNVSPEFVLEGRRLAAELQKAATPIVLEITEHVAITDYDAFRSALLSLGTPVRTAVDDAGAGFASFHHILELRPAFVKLDIGLVGSIDRDPARQALAAGMVHFARSTGCQLVAEGVETRAEAETLRHLGVGLGQGYLIGRPAPAAAWDNELRLGRRGSAAAGAVGATGNRGRRSSSPRDRESVNSGLVRSN